MELKITDTAKNDIKSFLKSGKANTVKKIEKLLIAIKDNPFDGIGKPEPLKYSLAGKWSRRIDAEYPLIYEVRDDLIYIISARGHY